MRAKIQNIEDLRAEIARLKTDCSEQKFILKAEISKLTDKLRYPMMILHKINHWFSGFAKEEKPGDGKNGPDWFTHALEVGLPMLASKFIFPQGGIIMRTVVALVSRQAAAKVNVSMFTDLISKVSDWFKPSSRYNGNPAMSKDYGIPPDSETY